MTVSPPGTDSPKDPPHGSLELQRVAKDLSEHVARTEAWMREALESAKMLGWELDLTTNRWTSTADLTEYYGLPPGLDYGDANNAVLAIHPDDVSMVLAQRRHAVETGEPMRYEFRGRVPAADGSPRWFSTSGRALRDRDGNALRLVAITTEVTARKRAEEERAALDRQLLDAQRWESLGVLAGGVAHDFNNILTIILGSAGLARRGFPSGHPSIMHFDQIEQACRRAGELCKQILAYTGRGSTPSGAADLNTLIGESKALLGVRISHSTMVNYSLGDNIPAVCAEPTQVRQVLLNLVTNAVEAIGDSFGEVRIETDTVTVGDETPIGYHLPPAPGRYARLRVSDTGPGIPGDVQGRMFDPFFTTKFAGRGLGLSAVLGILRTCRGAISVNSQQGKTVFEVLWPVVPEPASVIGPTPVPQTVSAGKALIVDDEIFVREVAASTVEELGYAPLLAADGTTAVRLFLEYREEIRFAVVDVMMPGMTGDQVLEMIRSENSELPVVMISGFTDRRTIRVGPGTRATFLQKPFHPEELQAAVSRLLQIQREFSGDP